MKKYLPITLILLLALAMRLPLLAGSFWLDEAAQALESARPFSEQAKIQADFQPPLLHYLVHFMAQLSKNEAWLREVSVVAGLLTIAALYFLLEEVSNRKVAAVAAMLLAINPFHIYFSQELRSYSLAAMFAAVSWLALVKKKPVWFIAACVGGMYSMYLYPFVTLAQVIYVWFEKRANFKPSLVWSILAYLFFLPWLPSFLGQLTAGMTVQATLPGWAEVVGTPQGKALPLVLAKFVMGQTELRDSRVYYLLAGFGVLVFLWASLSLRKDKKVRLFLYWFWVTVVASWLFSFVIPVIQPKRVMIALPAMAAIFAIWALRKGRWKQVALALVASVLIFFTCLYWVNPKYQREDWRRVIAQVETDASSRKTAALFAFTDAFAPWRWYGKGDIPALSPGTLLTTDKTDLHAVALSLNAVKRVYFFTYLTDLTDPQGRLKQLLLQLGFREIRDINGGNLGLVRVFDRL